MPPLDGKPYRLLGNSRFVDQDTGLEHHNSWNVHDDGQKLSVKIGALGRAREARALKTRNRHTRWFVAEMQNQITAEEYRNSPPRIVPKQQRARCRTTQCPECNNVREIYLNDRLVPCPVCTGRHD